MKVHRIYYATEFAEIVSKPLFGKPVHTLELISIGMTDDAGRGLYCINSEFDVKKAWDQYTMTANRGYPSGPRQFKVHGLRNGVLRNLFQDYYKPNLSDLLGNPAFTRRNMQEVIDRVGKPVDLIAQQVREFIYAEAVGSGSDCLDPADFCIDGWLEGTRIELVAESGDYNHVLLAGLFGTRLDWPRGLPNHTTSLQQKLNRLTELHENRLLHVGQRGVLMQELRQTKPLHTSSVVPLQQGKQTERLFSVAALAGGPHPESAMPNALICYRNGIAIPEWTSYGNRPQPFYTHPNYPKAKKNSNSFDDAQYAQQLYQFLATE